ncbi:hypothetical protein BDV27DRAFT_127725, partial [Aspergillus caelatus]
MVRSGAWSSVNGTVESHVKNTIPSAGISTDMTPDLASGYFGPQRLGFKGMRNLVARTEAFFIC